MHPLLIHNARIITESAFIPHGWLLCENGIIRAYAEGMPPSLDDAHDSLNAQGAWLAPAFIDVHVHGAMNAELMDGTPDALATMGAFYAQHGVASYLPTTLSGARDDLLRALRAVATYARQPHEAQIIGVHLEGPYLNVAKCGAQKPEHIRLAHHEEANALLDTGVIRLLSLAPEFEENQWLIAECVARGITSSIAHTNATYEQALHAFALGITHSTHTFNAMTGLHHRLPGVVGAVMGDARVRCELIADLVHVHEGAIRALFAAKGTSGLILITDAMRASGMPDGQYALGEHTVTVADGTATLVNGTLAGSIATYDACVQNFVRVIGKPFDELWQVTSLTPAQAVGVADRKGSIALGKDADLVLLDDALNVRATVILGGLVPRSASALSPQEQC